MKNETVKQAPPQIKMGGGFSLDISKATKQNASEDNH